VFDDFVGREATVSGAKVQTNVGALRKLAQLPAHGLVYVFWHSRRRADRITGWKIHVQSRHGTIGNLNQDVMGYDAKILEVELVDDRSHRCDLHVASELLEPIELTSSVRTLFRRARAGFLTDELSERARLEASVELAPA